MFLFGLLAASLTFSATATGVKKETAVEFLFAGKGTDREYETMFVLDRPVNAFCDDLEKAGLPRGKPANPANARLWPVGCKLRFDPPISRYVSGKMPEGLSDAQPVYTGGARLPDGSCDAATNMPLSVFSIFTLAQSPIVFDGIYEQGAVYGAFTARETFPQGQRVTFTVSWDPESMPKELDLTARPGKGAELVSFIREQAVSRDLDVKLSFDGAMTVREATGIAKAMSVLDSNRVRLNGSSNIFYRAFLPLLKWKDRKERLVQPFELTICDNDDRLVFISEDWSGPGDDPVLTPVKIPFAEAKKHTRTDTCFVYTDASTPVSRVLSAIEKLKGSTVVNWYVFSSAE